MSNLFGGKQASKNNDKESFETGEKGELVELLNRRVPFRYTLGVLVTLVVVLYFGLGLHKIETEEETLEKRAATLRADQEELKRRAADARMEAQTRDLKALSAGVVDAKGPQTFDSVSSSRPTSLESRHRDTFAAEHRSNATIDRGPIVKSRGNDFYVLFVIVFAAASWWLCVIRWPVSLDLESSTFSYLCLGVFGWSWFHGGFGYAFMLYGVGLMTWVALFLLLWVVFPSYRKTDSVDRLERVDQNYTEIQVATKVGQLSVDQIESIRAEYISNLEEQIHRIHKASYLDVDQRTIEFCRSFLKDCSLNFDGNERRGATVDEWIAASKLPSFAISYIRYVQGRFRSKYEELKAKEQRVERAITALAEQILNEHEEKVERFYEIAYRKTVATDEYGDEDAEALNREIPKLISKLKFESENFAKFTDGQSFDKRQIEDKITQTLADRFKVYYLEQKSVASTVSLGQLQDMSGTDFEHFVVGLLKEAGAADARPTPGSGDQGADVLFSFNGLKIVVQTKRHSKPVGNKAIQEVYAAKAYYKCDVAWAISSSTFTDSARRLARETGVHLFESVDLPRFNERFAEFFKATGRKRVG